VPVELLDLRSHVVPVETEMSALRRFAGRVIA